VFLLEMGEQVRILDLARQLIRLAGMREGEDIEIMFTGLRPGEKLFEELHSDAERTRMTRHERILAWELDARDERELLAEVDELARCALDGDPRRIKTQLHRIVPEYVEPQHAPWQPLPAAPVVELPAAAPPAPAPAPMIEWQTAVRRGVETAIAGLMLFASLPAWIAVMIEARVRGEREFLLRETRVGRTRRVSQRRSQPVRALIDRRANERRVQDQLGQPFTCWRFRPDLGPASRWLAHHRLDKLPFLLNVLRHEMTLVGPNPEKEQVVLRYGRLVPDYPRRFTVLPGLTGLAQVSDCGEEGAEGIVRRTHYDLFYIDHRSLLLDLRTLWRTADVVLRHPRHERRSPAPESVSVTPGARPGAEPVHDDAVVKGVIR
ncbi:MAG TPA: sugar transferase, partial [Dongiaceae bacterium]|nr:sugar transferase [Dongiaceae bacterium]